VSKSNAPARQKLVRECRISPVFDGGTFSTGKLMDLFPGFSLLSQPLFILYSNVDLGKIAISIARPLIN
jgi:hypothetical protein